MTMEVTHAIEEIESFLGASRKAKGWDKFDVEVDYIYEQEQIDSTKNVVIKVKLSLDEVEEIEAINNIAWRHNYRVVFEFIYE